MSAPQPKRVRWAGDVPLLRATAAALKPDAPTDHLKALLRYVVETSGPLRHHRSWLRRR